MAKRQIFYSFHYKNDVMRVQLVRNIGALEDNKPISPNDWEEVKAKGDKAVEEWIENNMSYRSCVVVLVGEETANRPWVKYEIQKAWDDGKGLLGVYIHNLNCANNGTCKKGPNPFDQFTIEGGLKMSSVVNCYNPDSSDAYNDIRTNLEDWIEDAIKNKNKSENLAALVNLVSSKSDPSPTDKRGGGRYGRRLG